MRNYIGEFTSEEGDAVGRKMKVICVRNGSYEHCITVGKEYEIEITPKLLPLSPLWAFVGDNGKSGECHLDRFKKKEIQNENV